MNLRLLVLVALAWVAWRFWQQWQQRRGDLRGPQPPPSAQQKPGAEPFELMQRCAQCGTYLPSTALSRSGRCGRCSD
ncbi:MAG: hypothetical protein JWQ90_5370 [Hydrocarboniphaga sp.]|uniref:hypothetical protein n=1 Tax=Hydrocarboniphaga sp. TaxID=2033016 RepID=UPI002621F4CF|nr:hypothetical protein [Hydrocarboniphaga sp.]MDB5972920.1 hypothetical protein [Hydrocarboniphaga sp.]